MKLSRIAFFLLASTIVLWALFPLYWAGVTSLKVGSAAFNFDWFPSTLLLRTTPIFCTRRTSRKVLSTP